MHVGKFQRNDNQSDNQEKAPTRENSSRCIERDSSGTARGVLSSKAKGGHLWPQRAPRRRAAGWAARAKPGQRAPDRAEADQRATAAADRPGPLGPAATPAPRVREGAGGPENPSPLRKRNRPNEGTRRGSYPR